LSFAATLGAARRKAALSGWKRDAVLGAAVALFALCLHAAAGFPSLAASHGDNDSLLRLVQVRDLLGGQGWYDLHQYRMGPEGGFVMHWSRLVDAPVAAIVLAGAALGADMATGETVALIAWPLLLLAAAQTFLIRIARTLGDDWAILPALTIGGAALYFVGLFSPGNIDHHNLQLVLTLAAVAALVADGGFRAGLLAGVASALMLAIGMETLPYVAVAGLAAAIALLAAGRPEAAKATGFGLGFAACGAAAFLATVPPGAWLAAQCDAYSIPQFVVALAAGLGLAVVSVFALLRETFVRRLAGLTAAGVAIVAVAALFFPQCLADPYAGLDPRLQTFWLSAVTEAQPVWSVVAKNQAMAVSYYVTPLLGLIVLGWRMRRRGIGSAGLVVAAFLATAFAVSLWQVRGAMFAIPLAAIPLSAWVGTWRERAASGGSGSTLGMVLAWLVSLNLAWGASANAVAKALGRPVSPGAEASAGTCDRAADFAALAAMPATAVLAISNLGAPILVHTHHRVFAGPYHRNVEGNLIALEAFMGSEQEALAIARTSHVGLVALCRGNDETGALARWAPSGFMAALARGGAPGWLEKVPATSGKPLELYRVLP
jgi:hypothetical protein